VPLAAIQVVSAQQADTLGEHGVTDIDGLVNTSVDDLVEFLDVSLDEAEKILGAARSVIEIRERNLQPATEEGGESEAAPDAEGETVAASAEPEAEAAATGAVSSEEPTAEGSDEAAAPLRPDVITPAPDLAAPAVADPDAAESAAEVAASAEGDALVVEATSTETSSALESSSDEQAATDESLKDEKQ
jgi:hypothetical protein